MPIPPIYVVADGSSRPASAAELIEQAARLYTVNMLKLLQEGTRFDGMEPPEESVDLYAHVVERELCAALLSGFSKATKVPRMLREVES